MELLPQEPWSDCLHLGEHVPPLLCSEPQDDQPSITAGRVRAHIGKAQVQGQEGSTFVAANGPEPIVRSSREPLLQRRARIETERSQEAPRFLREVLVDLDPRYAAPGFRGAWRLRASSAA